MRSLAQVRGVWVPAVTREPWDLVDILKRGVRCRDVLPLLKDIACAGNEDSERIPIDNVKTECWERMYAFLQTVKKPVFWFHQLIIVLIMSCLCVC